MAALQVTSAQIAEPGAAAPDAPNSAAREFEAMFLTQMVDEMMKQVDIGDFGGGQAEETWRYFLAEAFGREIAEQGGAGIAASLRGALEAYTESRTMEQRS
nr:rod-binding protein [Salipiger pentaromativorans]